MSLQPLARAMGNPFGPPGHALAHAHLARVTDVDDPENLARVRVEFYAFDTDRDVAPWARIAAPFAGPDSGAFMIPSVGDEVLVVFVGGDPRAPVVVGSLWNGRDRPPERIGSRVDRWTITGRAGTRIAIVEGGGGGTIVCETPGGVTLELADSGSGSVEIECAGNHVVIDQQGVVVKSSLKVEVSATSVDVTAASVNVDAAYSKFSGVVDCQTLMTQSVISPSYTPGAGNMW